MSREREKFEGWWKVQGQFCCASGQSDQKSVIYEAWLAGYHEALIDYLAGELRVPDQKAGNQ